MTETKGRSNGYPFMTQAEVAIRLQNEEPFRLECLAILCERQTPDELEERATKHTNKKGLRCSESVWMPELYTKIQGSPEQVTPEEMNRLTSTLHVYRKQLAAHFRTQMLEQDPSLGQKAALFGV